MDSDTGDGAPSVVEVRIPADPRKLTLLRMIAETVALSNDLTVDEASDIRLAVDEAASLLIADAVPDALLSVRFTGCDTEFGVQVAATSASDALPKSDGFSWQILQRLTHWVEAEQEPFDANKSGFPRTIRFGHHL